MNDQLSLCRYLTDGTFGRCFTVADGQEHFVAKIMRAAAKHHQYIGDAKIEAAYLAKLMSAAGCPQSIVTFYRSIIIPDPCNDAKTFHALIFEECACSLHEFWQRNYQPRRVTWHIDDIRSVAFQLLECCKFLHDLGFTHTDIKHKNVMLKWSEDAPLSAG